MSYWSIFVRKLLGFADFASLKFQRMAYSPTFAFFIATGPVGHPSEFKSEKSAIPTRFLSKIDQWLIKRAGDIF